MKRVVCLLAAGVVLASLVAYTANAPGQTDREAASVFGGNIPHGYREWGLISVAHEEGGLNDLRAILGNDVAIKVSRDGKLPYPDGAIIARLAWNYAPLAESEKAFGHLQSFVAGTPKNGVQFMIKDSEKFASTGGWAFAEFNDGKPTGEAKRGACLSCHQTVAARDFVFNRYAP